jgi:putative SOS response-associated peptidase YedK
MGFPRLYAGGNPPSHYSAAAVRAAGTAKWDDARNPPPVSNAPKKTATGKQPYAIAQADRRLMALAGLWENWRSPAGEWVRSFAIITTTPNALCPELHNRMPVVLKPESWPAWLSEEAADACHLKALLAPHPADEPARTARLGGTG